MERRCCYESGFHLTRTLLLLLLLLRPVLVEDHQ